MSDRIPKVSIDDVLRIIKRDFPGYNANIIMAILNEYSSDSAGSRVHLAVLKLSEKNIEKLREWVERANIDFRDVLSPAEYPRFHVIGFGAVDLLSRKEIKKIKDNDWNQYQEWLNRET